MTRLAILCLLLVGCGEGSHSGPIVRDHGWEDGAYTVRINGNDVPIVIDGDDFHFAGTKIDAAWYNHRQTTRGGSPLYGWWYMGKWRGVNVGIRRGYEVRVFIFIYKAEPVKGNG